MVSAPPPSSCATANTTHTLARTPSGTAQRRRTRMCCGNRTAGKLHARTRLSDQRVPACPSARGRVAHTHAHTHPCVCTRMRIHTHACVFCPCPPFRPLSATHSPLTQPTQVIFGRIAKARHMDSRPAHETLTPVCHLPPAPRRHCHLHPTSRSSHLRAKRIGRLAPKRASRARRRVNDCICLQNVAALVSTHDTSHRCARVRVCMCVCARIGLCPPATYTHTRIGLCPRTHSSTQTRCHPHAANYLELDHLDYPHQ